MSFCKNCGRQLENDANFCAYCGTLCSDSAAAQQITFSGQIPEIIIPGQDGASYAAEKPSGKLNMGQLVWSILNLIACCMPLGIVSLIMTVGARNARSAKDEAKKLKNAKLFNIIGTACMFFLILGFGLSIFHFPFISNLFQF